MPLFTGGEFTRAARRADGRAQSQVLFPIVVLLGLNGLVVGILNAYDHFTIPAISPLVWNVVIIVFLVGARAALPRRRPALRLRDRRPRRHGRAARDGAARSCGASASSFELVVRLARPAGQAGLRADAAGDHRPRDHQLRPADQLDRSARCVSDQAPRAIDAAFRIYMLPAGHVQRRDRDRAVPGAEPLRRAPRLRRAARRARPRRCG